MDLPHSPTPNKKCYEPSSDRKKKTKKMQQIKMIDILLCRLVELKLQDIVEIICHRFLYENMSIFLNDLLYNL